MPQYYEDTFLITLYSVYSLYEILFCLDQHYSVNMASAFVFIMKRSYSKFQGRQV